MSVAPLKAAIASTRQILTQVDAGQLGDPTPCAKWPVSELINHIVGGQFFFAAAASGEPPGGDAPDYSAGDFLGSFDEGAAAAVAAFSADGVMERTLTLPWGPMPGAAFAGLAATDTFQHGWDLAKATGQSTDLAPELAENLLVGARAGIGDAFRDDAGSVFRFEQQAPEGACAADRLAAFLGRTV